MSFQPDKSISFGLNDKTFVSTKFMHSFSVWNAYNRIEIVYTLTSTSDGLEAVENPHFTFHPATLFHLTGNKGGQELFRGIADVSIVLEQQGLMPWIRAVSAPISTLISSGVRQDGVVTNDWEICTSDKEQSVQIELDLVKASDAREYDDTGQWDMPWGDVALRCRLGLRIADVPTLSWFYSH